MGSEHRPEGAKDAVIDPAVVAARTAEVARAAAETTAALTQRTDADRARLLLGVRAAMAVAEGRRRRLLLCVAFSPIALALVSLAVMGPALWRDRVGRPSPGLRAPEWEQVQLGDRATLRILRGTDYFVPAIDDLQAQDGVEVDLRQGTLCAKVNHRDPARRGPFIVRAPGLSAWDVGTDFCVATVGRISTVEVNEGIVWVERPAHAGIEVRAGEWVRSDDSRLLAPRAAAAISAGPSAGAIPLPGEEPLAPALSRPIKSAPSKKNIAVATVAESDCEAGGVSVRRACYEFRASGNTISAQTALYGLALLDARELQDGSAAVRNLRLYQARFPRGFLSPEVSFALIAELNQHGDLEGAEHEARSFLTAFPDHPRSDEVALWLGDLLVELRRPAEARPAYERCLGGRLQAEARARLAHMRHQLPTEENLP